MTLTGAGRHQQCCWGFSELACYDNRTEICCAGTAATPCPKADTCGGSATDPTCVPKRHGGRGAALPIAEPSGAGSTGVGEPSHRGAEFAEAEAAEAGRRRRERH